MLLSGLPLDEIAILVKLQIISSINFQPRSFIRENCCYNYHQNNFLPFLLSFLNSLTCIFEIVIKLKLIGAYNRSAKTDNRDYPNSRVCELLQAVFFHGTVTMPDKAAIIWFGSKMLLYKLTKKLHRMRLLGPIPWHISTWFWL